MPGRASSERPYLPALDGLRALAVAAVVAYHLGRVPGGFLGVDLFFVISGYLITSLLLGEVRATGRVSLRSFWLRRFRRLLPALLLVLIATAVAGAAWLPSWRLGGLRTDALATLAYVANWRFIASGQSYFASGIGPSPLRHAWSLGIEEQFYVLWPLLVLLALRAGRDRARAAVGLIAGLGMVASAAWMAHLASGAADLSRSYYGTDSRAFTLLIGVLLAAALAPGDGRRAKPRTALPAAAALVGLPALAGSVAFVAVAANDRGWMYPGGFLAFAGLSALLVAGSAHDRGPLVAALSVRPLRWLGRVSYGVYLWSWPTEVFAQAHFHLRGWRLDVTVVGIALGAAALSARLIERPIRAGRLLAGRPAALRWSVPPLALALVAGAVVLATAGATPVPSFLTVSDRAASAQAFRPATRPPPPVPQPRRATAASGAPVPVPTSLGRAVRVMVTGDSVGWSLGYNQGLVKDGLVDDRGLIGCGIMPQSQSRWITAALPDPQSYYPNCDRQEEAENLGLQGRPDAVVLSVGTWEIYDQQYAGRRWVAGSADYAALLTRLLQARIARYRYVGAVTLLTLVPCYGDMAPRLGEERRDPGRVAWINDLLRRVARSSPGDVVTVDPGEIFCVGGRARATVPGVGDLRPDGVHFSEASARWIWDTWLIPKATHAVLAKQAALLQLASDRSTTGPGA